MENLTWKDRCHAMFSVGGDTLECDLPAKHPGEEHYDDSHGLFWKRRHQEPTWKR